MSADPRPSPRVVNSSAGVEKIRQEGRCRACGLPGLPIADGGRLTRAHIVGKGQRGDDVDENIIPLCGSGTEGCHAAFDGQQPFATEPSLLKGASSETIRRAVYHTMTEPERGYVIEKKGEWWLEKLAA